MKRKLQGLAAVACALWVSGASAAPSVVEVRLAVEEPAQVEAEGEVQAGGVVRLRPVHSGRLEVRVGRRVLVDCYVAWGESKQAWTDARAGANLGPRQQQLLHQLEDLLEQLKDAARSPRDKP